MDYLKITSRTLFVSLFVEGVGGREPRTLRDFTGATWWFTLRGVYLNFSLPDIYVCIYIHTYIYII